MRVQSDSEGDTSIQSDLWSLAIMALIICGKPIEADNRPGILVKIATEVPPTPSRVQPDVPDGFDEWFARACHRSGISFANVRSNPSPRFNTPKS